MVARTLAGSLGLKGDWDLGEDNWKAGMDENLLKLSVLTQGRFVDQVSALPGAPTEGMVYICAAAHATNPNQVAIYDEGAWTYLTPLEGWRLYNTTLKVFSQFTGSTWANDTSALTAEDVRDTIAAALRSGTNVTVVNDDAADTITINSTGGGGGLTAEQVMDTIAAMLQQGSGISLTYNDAADQLTIAATAGGGGGIISYSAYANDGQFPPADASVYYAPKTGLACSTSASSTNNLSVTVTLTATKTLLIGCALGFQKSSGQCRCQIVNATGAVVLPRGSVGSFYSRNNESGYQNANYEGLVTLPAGTYTFQLTFAAAGSTAGASIFDRDLWVIVL